MCIAKTITMHHEGKLSHASIPYSTRTSELPETTLYTEPNLMHASFPSITSINTLP